MSLFNWDEKYSVKVDSLDTQHKKWIDLINTAHAALTGGESSNKTSEFIQQVIDYTQYHFDAEEKLLEENDYPDLAIHKEQHKNFVEKVASLKSDLDEGKEIEGLDFLALLLDWMLEHINGSDKKYSDLLTSRGVK
jgi:hemerythrin